MAEHRRSFLNAGEDRRLTLTWPRQVPIAGEPENVVQIVNEYVQCLATTNTPKLFINAGPGLFCPLAADFIHSWPNVTEESAKGIHFIQEDLPDDIGKAVAAWLPE